MASCAENLHHYRRRHRHRQGDHQLQMPDDVLIDLLSRLPVKSLMRFKCVCKHWYDLIQNPSFAHTHLQFQKSHEKGRLLLQHFNQYTNRYNYALFPDETLATGAYRHLDYLQGSDEGSVSIEGPINGLFCLFNNKDRVILWNPAIREFRFLPYPDPDLPSYLRVSTGSIGFGIDPLTEDDYKVVLIRNFSNSIKQSEPVSGNAMVYSLRSDTWRHVDGLNSLLHGSLIPPSGSNTYLNGSYHWFVYGIVENDFACAVIAFDMSKEVFREIPGPDIDPSEFLGSCCDLTLYEGRIALHHLKGFSPTEVDIWVMDEEEGSWVKQFKLGPLPRIVWQLGFWKTGELLFVMNDSRQPFSNHSSQLVLYNPSTQEIRKLGPKGIDCLFQAVVYSESLISVEGGKYRRKGKLSEFSMQNFFLRDLRHSFMSPLVQFMGDFQRSGIEQSIMQAVRGRK